MTPFELTTAIITISGWNRLTITSGWKSGRTGRARKLLAKYDATMENIVDEVLFVTDMEAAFDAAVKCRPEVFSGLPVVASTIVQVGRLAFPELMIEIKCVAKL